MVAVVSRCESFSAPWTLTGGGKVRAEGSHPDAMSTCDKFSGPLLFFEADGVRLYASEKDIGGVVLTGSKFVPHVP